MALLPGDCRHECDTLELTRVIVDDGYDLEVLCRNLPYAVAKHVNGPITEVTVTTNLCLCCNMVFGTIESAMSTDE